jgi:hypothetical protein
MAASYSRYFKIEAQVLAAGKVGTIDPDLLSK